MRGSNFVAFLTVQGFIAGIVFGLLQSDNAEEFLVYVLLISIFFYLFAHMCVGFYFQTLGVKAHSFPKHTHERSLDGYVREINRREQFIDAYYANKDELLSSDEGRKA
ncbi:MAG TPA: hypothetical protein PLM93_06945 [Sulfuricurvum sp.]|nr:MAG: hypothetical protein B7Y30_01100 [Campylobacterales bacterium 16-40-21]OZA03014.1 MAG: hypothetical protein B7X89_06690 [Sulfuricurvum sp. 17-40-25]HQS66903.1 hypothetical protein [Sulfuricurvum sp.]HQT35641.1 hypothetical protein [Sulfuricurvum sp.]